MPTIDVSGEQRAFLQTLRDELQDEVQYGSVREQDALQYLIDHFEGGGDPEVDADDDVAVDAGAVGEATESGSASPSADGGAVAAAESADAERETETDTESGGDGGSSTDAAGDDRLNAMMNLLDTHEDKWRETTQGDARYEIDMPDGTTEYAQTKDDVRAHIFKNYD